MRKAGTGTWPDHHTNPLGPSIRRAPEYNKWFARRLLMIYTRRDFGRIAIAAVPIATAFAAKINSKFGGVQIGAITYSFRGTNDLDAIVKMLVDSGVGEV